MRILNLTIALLATVTLAGCASGLGGGDYQRAEASQKEAARRVTQTAQEKATADVRLTDAQLIAQRAADTHATAQAAEQAALRDLGAARTRLEAAWQAKQQSASRTVGF